MALINCKNCGKMISDKAKACPHCGTTVDFEQSVNDQLALNQNQEMEPNRVVTFEPIEYYEEPERKSHAGLIIAAILGLLALLGVGGWLWYDNNQKRAEQERQLAILAEKARQDSIAAAELREQARQDSIAEAKKQEQIQSIRSKYISIVKNYANKYDRFNHYFLFDFTGDGICELGVQRGICNADYQYDIFTVRDGNLVLLGQVLFGGSVYRGSNYVIIVLYTMGSELWHKVSYSGGKVVGTEVYAGECDYDSPSEPEMSTFCVTDTDPINAYIK